MQRRTHVRSEVRPLKDVSPAQLAVLKKLVRFDAAHYLALPGRMRYYFGLPARELNAKPAVLQRLFDRGLIKACCPWHGVMGDVRITRAGLDLLQKGSITP